MKTKMAGIDKAIVNTLYKKGPLTVRGLMKALGYDKIWIVDSVNYMVEEKIIIKDGHQYRHATMKDD